MYQKQKINVLLALLEEAGVHCDFTFTPIRTGIHMTVRADHITNEQFKRLKDIRELKPNFKATGHEYCADIEAETRAVVSKDEMVKINGENALSLEFPVRIIIRDFFEARKLA